MNLTEQGPRVIELPDGRALGYCEYGAHDGVPLIALHGTPGSCLMMQPGHLYALARGIRMIAPDRPGYGRSGLRPGYGLADWVADIGVLLDRLGIERCFVFGVSGGGPFACALASLLGERVSALALVSPVGLFDERVRRGFSTTQWLAFEMLPGNPPLMRVMLSLGRAILLSAPDPFFSVFYFRFAIADRRLLADPQHRAALIATFQDGIRAGNMGVAEDLRLFANDWHLPLERIDVPTFVWQGLEDRQVPPSATFLLTERIPEARLFTLDEAGHFWVLAHFGDVLDRLLAASGDAAAT